MEELGHFVVEVEGEGRLLEGGKLPGVDRVFLWVGSPHSAGRTAARGLPGTAGAPFVVPYLES